MRVVPQTSGRLPGRGTDVKRATAAGDGEQGKVPCHLAAVESKALQDCPSLVAHMVTIRYDDGASRSTGTLYVKIQGPNWYVTVKDPDARLQMTGIGASFDDALAAVELMLGMEKPPWEVDRWAERQEPRKKTK